ncbi:indole-3-glycerol phosphate synthase TrpC [Persephonella sp.]|uniref:indole-3-glycerol phosphate synthase TrpC n=1 Tax=Persephonella sp. TaxID=2060922 RepID=UPI002631B196|nr:indole-3-glycerol phosphate synthase TrpC [Persephonella sp.]
MNILDKIIQTKKEELLDYTPDYIEFLEKKVLERDKVRDFKGALTKNEINIIAEIKKASPSKGVIREDFDPVKIAKIYEENGAAAISVLTDKTYFQGDIQYLKMVRRITSIPLLRKDFIIDKRQILEAYAYGADSFLLIARVLSEKEMEELIKYGREFGMEPLVEIHSLEEGAKSINAGATIIGINNRDLETFKVDINLSKKLAPELKELGAQVVVAESGISSRKEILELKGYCVDAFLIGESLMREKDIGKKLRELLGS